MSDITECSLINYGTAKTSVQRLGVLIVNYNGAPFISECIKSLFGFAPSTVEVDVVLVDNASPDDSIAVINDTLLDLSPQHDAHVVLDNNTRAGKRTQQVTRFSFVDSPVKSFYLVSANENYGFAGGNNIAAEVLDEQVSSEVDFFWLLNSDTIVAPDSLRELVATLNSDPELIVCGTAILYHHEPHRIQSMGGSYYQVLTGRAWACMQNETYHKQIDELDIVKKINFVSGASLVISSTAWRNINGLSEDYFLYNEEIDLTFRLPKTARFGVASKARVYHKVGGSIGTESIERPPSPLSAFYQARSKLIFAAKHTPKYYPVVLLFLIFRALKYLVVYRYVGSANSIVRAILVKPRTLYRK